MVGLEGPENSSRQGAVLQPLGGRGGYKYFFKRTFNMTIFCIWETKKLDILNDIHHQKNQNINTCPFNYDTE